MGEVSVGAAAVTFCFRVNAEPMETPVNKVLLVSSDRPVHLDFLEFPE